MHLYNTAAIKEESRKKREAKFSERLLKLMREMFGVENVNWSKTEEDQIEILVDSNLAVLNTKSLVREILCICRQFSAI